MSMYLFCHNSTAVSSSWLLQTKQRVHIYFCQDPHVFPIEDWESWLGLEPMHTAAKLRIFLGLYLQKEHILFLSVFSMMHPLGGAWWNRQTLVVI